MYDCNQVQAKLLCDACEHRLAVQGENWVIECTCQKDGAFPLRDILLRNTPVQQVGPTSTGRVAHVYAAAGLGQYATRKLSILLLASFGADGPSIGRKVSEVSQLNFPDGLGNQFRDFLLGKSAFPSSVILQVEVALNPVFTKGNLGMIFPDKITPRISNPTIEPIGYFFMVFGITFMLYFDLGKAAGLHTKVLSIAEPPHAISLTDVRMLEVDADYNRLDSTAKRVGKLARG